MRANIALNAVIVRCDTPIRLPRTLVLAGITSAGRALVRALGSPDDNIRNIAGILLVKSGKRAEPLLQEALTRRENLPTVLTVLGSIGDPALIPQLRQFADDQNPDVAKGGARSLKSHPILRQGLKFHRRAGGSPAKVLMTP